MRLFIALPLPLTVENSLGTIISDLKPHDGKIRWVNPSNIHLTLRFLGETEQKRLPELKQLIIAASENQKPFQATISRIGAFPNLRQPRIIWAGFAEDSVVTKIADLASSIEHGVRNIGFENEKKKFRPHLTLARIKDPSSLQILPKVLQDYSLDPIDCQLDRLCLFQSTLTPKGPIYKRLVDIELGAERMSG